MRLGITFGAALFLALAFPSSGVAQEQALTYEMARAAAEAAEAEARSNDWNVTIIVTDAEAVPIYLKRLTGASPRSYEIAMRKARTSVASGLTTAVYGERLEAGQVAEVPDGVTFAGGVPIVVDGEVVGAVATSGVAAIDDAQISQAGVDVIVR
ncbi:MAG: heme-binding protein [Gemmatimonadota bacterium]